MQLNSKALESFSSTQKEEVETSLNGLTPWERAGGNQMRPSLAVLPPPGEDKAFTPFCQLRAEQGDALQADADPLQAINLL